MCTNLKIFNPFNNKIIEVTNSIMHEKERLSPFYLMFVRGSFLSKLYFNENWRHTIYKQSIKISNKQTKKTTNKRHIRKTNIKMR